MTQQLKTQREELVAASEINEKRRQFTEAVVEGVSAGIVGLDAFGGITLVNARAAEMIGTDEITPIGKRLGEVIPALAPIFERARSSRRGQMRDQIEIGSGPDYRTYQVQLTREGTMTESKGYVVTLDDITDLLSAQRTGAWADVARRIAHEIKNPLTPIQLAAERLRRRYAAKLGDDFEVFDKSHQHHPPPGRRHRPHGRRVLVVRAHAGGKPRSAATSATRSARRCSSKACGCPRSRSR